MAQAIVERGRRRPPYQLLRLVDASRMRTLERPVWNGTERGLDGRAEQTAHTVDDLANAHEGPGSQIDRPPIHILGRCDAQESVNDIVHVHPVHDAIAAAHA